ncbi:MAG: TonB-dependent receptor [Pseudomonadota bacterium]
MPISYQDRTATRVTRGLLLTLTALGAPAFAQQAFPTESKLTESEPITVIASRTPVTVPDVASSLTVITRDTILALDPPQAVDLLRLAPGVDIARSGPTGSQTQVRLRGSEANQTLVFVDGIASNDPASADEFRWEFLPADGLEQVELIRGPQSALWGSEALGGVVSATTFEPGTTSRAYAAGQFGSFDTIDLSAAAALADDTKGISVLGTYFDTDGTDAFSGGPVEREGFDSFTLTGKAHIAPTPDAKLGIVARYQESDIEFDGNDPVTFARADTLSASENRQFAVRAYGEATLAGIWTHRLDGSWLQTDNTNTLDDVVQTVTDGETFRLVYQNDLEITTGAFEHRLTSAVEFRGQSFSASDTIFGGLSDQKVDRERVSVIGDYAVRHDRFDVGASVRHDDHDTFRNATTFRVAGAVRVHGGFQLRGSVGEGFATPTFTEQFGFFPASFIGNPDLEPEESFGWDAGVVWSDGTTRVEATYFEADLEDEIVTVFDAAFNTTAANATGESERQGVELSGETVLGPVRLIASYTFLDADEQVEAGGPLVREIRRARHSADLIAIADLGPVEVAATANYVGDRTDLDFGAFPAATVTLGDYVLANLSARYRLTDRIALTARVDNILDEDYEDVLDFETQGISAHGGITVSFGG